jgi:hypothetical protein
MKNHFFLLFLFACNLYMANAENRTIINPDYRFRSSGIYTISKIELKDTVTKLYLHMTGSPKALLPEAL